MRLFAKITLTTRCGIIVRGGRVRLAWERQDLHHKWSIPRRPLSATRDWNNSSNSKWQDNDKTQSIHVERCFQCSRLHDNTTLVLWSISSLFFARKVPRISRFVSYKRQFLNLVSEMTHTRHLDQSPYRSLAQKLLHACLYTSRHFTTEHWNFRRKKTSGPLPPFRCPAAHVNGNAPCTNIDYGSTTTLPLIISTRKTSRDRWKSRASTHQLSNSIQTAAPQVYY